VGRALRKSHKRAAKGAGVEEEDLEQLPLSPVEVADIVGPGSLPRRGIGRSFEKVMKDCCRLGLFGKLGPAVVYPVVVIVPDREDRAGFEQLSITGNGREHRVGGAHLVHVLGIGVDIVAEKYKEIGIPGDDRIPDRLFLFLIGTGSQRDACDEPFLARLTLRFRRGQYSDENGEEAGPDPVESTIIPC